MYIRFAAIFQTGRWNKITDQHVNGDLSSLAKKLPDMCLKSRANTTVRSYKNTFNKWCKWCVSHNIPSLPASDFHVSLYLIHLSDLCKSTSTINEAFYAINWAHNLAGLENPCKSDLVVTVREGAIRTVGHSISRKEPITPDILKLIVHKYGCNSANLKDLRLATMCLLCFAGFLRFSELANLKRDNVHFCSDHIRLFLEQSKTDVYREGKEVVISKTNQPTCPVSMLTWFLDMAKIPECSNEYNYFQITFIL